jgi:CNT family concentrative nucleoside transporter
MNRRAIRWRTVLSALVAQFAIGAFILFVPAGKHVLQAAAVGVNSVITFGSSGTEFMFGGLVQSKMFSLFGDSGFVFALRVLPIIVFVTSLISVMYYVGVMRWVVTILGTSLHVILGVSKLESFAAVSTIFLGQAEMPALVKPFAEKMTSAEIFAVMSSGMASVAGSVLAGYAGMGVRMDYLLASSFMAVPGGLLFAKLICPSTEPGTSDVKKFSFDEKMPANVIEAATSGAIVGMKIAVMVGAMLIAFVGLIALLNGFVSELGGWFGHSELSMQSLLGYVFAPIAYLIGVPLHEAVIAGSFIGEKIILNEFVAYASLSPFLHGTGTVQLDPRTLAILSFALCGFANLTSVAVMSGAFSAVAPGRRGEVAKYGLRVVLAGTLSNLMSAAIAGIFLLVTHG